MNSKNYIIALVLASICVNATAFKKRGKTKVKNSGPISLPGCGCQNPLFNIIDCGCRGPAEISYAVASYDAPVCGCQNPVIDIPQCADSIQISALGYLNPLEMANYGYLTSIAVPSVEYAPLQLPCGCQAPNCGCQAPNCGCQGSNCGCQVPNCGCQGSNCGCQVPNCGCRAPITLPAYPYGPANTIEVPSCGYQELRPGYAIGTLPTVMEIPSYSPVIQVQGCGCLGSCGCQSPLPCGCAGPACGCQSSMPCGCPGTVCRCQTLMPCGCPGPICGCESVMPCSCPGPVCGCQNSMPCSCPGPVCGCQSSMPCGCSGPVCGCQTPLPCGCQGPLCGCQSLSCGCPGPVCGCQNLEASISGCGCGSTGCQYSGKYLRQITLQPPFL